MEFADIYEDNRIKTISFDGKLWEIELEPGFCFSNGTSVAYFRSLSQSQILMENVKKRDDCV